MAFLAEYLNHAGALKKLWEERSTQLDVKMRDEAYRVHENAYLSRTSDGDRQNVTWRPIMLDGQVGDTRGREPINMTKQIGMHHTAQAARPPRTWNEPGGMESEEVAQRNTALIQRVFRDSKIKLVQTRQANHLAVYGDAVYGLVYDTSSSARRRLWVRGQKPLYCFPALDDQDPGILKDLLISYETRKGWAEKQFQVDIPVNKSVVRVCEYWDDEYRLVQVEDVVANAWTLRHKLGFTPWYWCFNQVPGMFAQADVAETPKLQGTMNELFILALDALRRNIDKAYYAVGHKGTITPVPGKAIGFPNPNVRVDEFPTAVPPGMITSLMQYVQQNAQSMAGISPISMEGLAENSIVTGTAVRHQVEAIEARAESKRTNLEAAYAWLGEGILKVVMAKLASHEMKLRVSGQEVTHKGAEVGDWTYCEASYGSFEGLTATDRGNWAMQGLGRVHGRRTAIALAYPDRDVSDMESEIDRYQMDQALLSAQAQAQAQQALQSSGGPAEQPSGRQGPVGGGTPAGPTPAPPQVKQYPPQPGLSSLGGMNTLSDLKLSIRLIRDQLRGDVYATGEMAVVGMSMAPTTAVTDDRDQAIVQSTLAPHKTIVRVGVDESEPRVMLNDE